MAQARLFSDYKGLVALIVMGKKGKKDEAAEETPDQVEWRNLKNEADRLHKQTKKEEHDFNEFQQQREKLNYFWIVEKKKLEDLRASLRNKEREQQDLEEKHHVEIKLYKQRLKHLLHEQQYERQQECRFCMTNLDRIVVLFGFGLPELVMHNSEDRGKA